MDRLTRDSTAAIAAGMSYGKWKALHPHTEYGDGNKVKLCKICGGIISRSKGRGGHNVLYCSYECADDAKRRRDRTYAKERRAQREAEPVRLCRICGKILTAREIGQGKQRKVYCSDECYLIGNNELKRAKRKTGLHTGAVDGK